VCGEAAFHDTAEALQADARRALLGTFAHVLLTDVSSSFADWHRASAGVPATIAAKVRDRVRTPLFSVMVAFRGSLGVSLDGMSFPRSTGLWWATRTQSKPGLERAAHGCECWTLISTPQFAVDEITALPMQDPVTGAFRPQENAYLNTGTGPAPTLLEAFLRATSRLRSDPSAEPTPEVVYLQGQRWGSAMPAPNRVDGRDAMGRCPSTVRLLDVAYESATPELVYDHPDKDGLSSTPTGIDFHWDNTESLYYAGDYCSSHNPGFEAAALSGCEAAFHIVNRLRDEDDIRSGVCPADYCDARPVNVNPGYDEVSDSTGYRDDFWGRAEREPGVCAMEVAKEEDGPAVGTHRHAADRDCSPKRQKL
jgi:hypothetical protein